LILFAFGVAAFADDLNTGWLHGLKVVAVAVVAQAVWGMARNLTPDAQRFSLAVGASFIAMLFPSSSGQIGAILMGAVVGMLWLGAKVDETDVDMRVSVGKTAGTISLLLFFGLLIGLPIIGLATTEMATAVRNGLNGYVDTRIETLIERMNLLLSDAAEAHRLSRGARACAAERFNINRFVRDWERAFASVTRASRPVQSLLIP